MEDEVNRDRETPVFGQGLTKREKEVFKLTVGEKDRKQIGEELGISVSTVQFHRGNIYRKCGGNTPLGMLVNGLKRGILLLARKRVKKSEWENVFYDEFPKNLPARIVPEYH